MTVIDADFTSAVAAPDLPDILPPVRQRRGIERFAVRHPAIAIGLVLLALER